MRVFRVLEPRSRNAPINLHMFCENFFVNFHYFLKLLDVTYF